MTMRFGSSRSPMASGAKRSLIRPSLQLAGKGGGELVLELAALDLAGRIGRDVVDEEVVPRPLEVRQVRALQAELVEHRRAQGRVLADDRGTDHLAPLAAGQPDRRRVGDARMLEQDVLDLGRVDVLRAALDRVDRKSV